MSEKSWKSVQAHNGDMTQYSEGLTKLRNFVIKQKSGGSLRGSDDESESNVYYDLPLKLHQWNIEQQQFPIIVAGKPRASKVLSTGTTKASSTAVTRESKEVQANLDETLSLGDSNRDDFHNRFEPQQHIRRPSSITTVTSLNSAKSAFSNDLPQWTTPALSHYPLMMSRTRMRIAPRRARSEEPLTKRQTALRVPRQPLKSETTRSMTNLPREHLTERLIEAGIRRDEIARGEKDKYNVRDCRMSKLTYDRDEILEFMKKKQLAKKQPPPNPPPRSPRAKHFDSTEIKKFIACQRAKRQKETKMSQESPPKKEKFYDQNEIRHWMKEKQKSLSPTKSPSPIKSPPKGISVNPHNRSARNLNVDFAISESGIEDLPIKTPKHKYSATTNNFDSFKHATELDGNHSSNLILAQNQEISTKEVTEPKQVCDKETEVTLPNEHSLNSTDGLNESAFLQLNNRLRTLEMNMDSLTLEALEKLKRYDQDIIIQMSTRLTATEEKLNRFQRLKNEKRLLKQKAAATQNASILQRPETNDKENDLLESDDLANQNGTTSTPEPPDVIAVPFASMLRDLSPVSSLSDPVTDKQLENHEEVQAGNQLNVEKSSFYVDARSNLSAANITPLTSYSPTTSISDRVRQIRESFKLKPPESSLEINKDTRSLKERHDILRLTTDLDDEFEDEMDGFYEDEATDNISSITSEEIVPEKDYLRSIEPTKQKSPLNGELHNGELHNGSPPDGLQKTMRNSSFELFQSVIEEAFTKEKMQALVLQISNQIFIAKRDGKDWRVPDVEITEDDNASYKLFLFDLIVTFVDNHFREPFNAEKLTVFQLAREAKKPIFPKTAEEFSQIMLKNVLALIEWSNATEVPYYKRHGLVGFWRKSRERDFIEIAVQNELKQEEKNLSIEYRAKEEALLDEIAELLGNDCVDQLLEEEAETWLPKKETIV